MTKKWIAINLLLLGIAGLLEWQLLYSVRRFNAENSLAKIQPVQDMKRKIIQDSLPQLPPAKNYLPAEFASIPEKNIFSESRTKEEKTETAASGDMPTLMQKPVLVGVTIMDGERKASIIDPTSSPQQRDRRAQIKRVGDVYQGYTITDIAPDHIVLESGMRKEIIPLHEGSKQRSPGKTAILSTRVVPIGPGGASGGAAVTVGAAIGSPARSTAAPGAPSAVPAATGNAPVAIQAPARQVRQPVQTPSQPAALPAASQPTVQPAVPQVPGRQIIRTPFGDVIRPNRD
jgi:hypothetical protein